MVDIEKIKKLVELQNLFNREREINDLYKEQYGKREKLVKENDSLSQTRDDIAINVKEMNKKINEELGKRDEINKRITSLDEGKDKIKIARQLKSWEKEMEKMQQELSLIQAQIDYDTTKQLEMQKEFDRLVERLDENNGRINELDSEIESIKNEHQGELESIKQNSDDICKEFEIQFSDYFMSMLEKSEGQAIVVVEEDACSGCNIVLPTQLQGDLGPELAYNNVQIEQCPHCFRYLYYNEWMDIQS